MFTRITIRQRILITFIAITLTGSLLQLIIAGRQLESATLEFYQHHLETDALLIASTLAEPIENYLEGDGTRDIQRTMATFQQDFGRDYLLVDSRYRVIGYSEGTNYEAVDYAPVTPELVLAEKGQIGADVRPNSTGENYLFVAVSVSYERETIGYLVLSRSMASAYMAVTQQWLQLASTTLPVILLVIVASLWISNTISRPVKELRNSALKMAGGEFNTRIQNDHDDEIGQLAQTFNYMAEQIEILLKRQRSFVSNAAHELRTPLMMLKLRAEALEDHQLPALERAVYLTEIQQEIDHMAGLVSSLLVLARVDEGRHKSNGRVVDTSALLHDSARHWRIEANNHNLEFEAHIPIGLPESPINPNDLRLILDNLLGNAIKYTPSGKIQFKAFQNKGRIILQICDTGIGFTPEQAVHLFDRFYRSDEVRAQIEGSGLGLSIVQAVLKQYEGNIVAESVGLGQGSTFTLTLPLTEETITDTN